MKFIFALLLSVPFLSGQWTNVEAAIELERKQNGIGAISLAVSDGERTLYTRHAGAATDRSLYRAGSITKLFTAVAIMQLTEQRKLDLDSPISRYLPELKQPITIRQISAHRSGLVREPGRGHYFDMQAASLRDVTRSVAGTTLVYPPGTQTKYSNAGVSLLGDVIERVSGESYENYVRAHIWKPLGMNDTQLRAAAVEKGRLPAAEMWTLDGRTFPAPVFDLATSSAGNLLTSAEDLLRFARWLMRSDTSPILRRASLDQMWQAQAGGTAFGIGFSLSQWDGERVIGHGGAVYGFSASLQVIPARKWAGVAFSTKDSTGFVLQSLLKYALNHSSAYKAIESPYRNTLAEFGSGLGDKAPLPPSAGLARQVGEYGWDYNKLYLLERAGKPYVLVEWFSLSELTPLSEARYRFGAGTMYAGEVVEVLPNGLKIGPVFFPRLPEPNRQFRIVMQKPLAELRRIAAGSNPPVQPPDLRKPDLVDLRAASNTLHFDIRYATKNNFMGTPLYSKPGAWLQRPAAAALVEAEKWLRQFGYGLLIHDGYRPWKVTKMFWEATPARQRNFVANPATGSRHNRGCAIDLSMYELSSGKAVEMVSGYDEFSDRAFPDYPGGTSRQRWLRGLLRKAMEDRGFTVNEDEWWHFDFRDWRLYPVADLSFEQLGSR